MLTLGKGDKQKVGGKALLKHPKQKPQKPPAPLGPQWSSRSRWVEVTAAGTQRARSASEGFVPKAEEAEGSLHSAAAAFQATPGVKPPARPLRLCGSGGFFRDRKQRNQYITVLAAVCALQPELSSRKEPWFPVNSPQLPFGLNYSLGSPYPSATRLSPACGTRNTQRRVPFSWLLVAAPFRVETGRADTELAGGRASQRRASSFPHTWGAARPRG